MYTEHAVYPSTCWFCDVDQHGKFLGQHPAGKRAGLLIAGLDWTGSAHCHCPVTVKSLPCLFIRLYWCPQTSSIWMWHYNCSTSFAKQAPMYIQLCSKEAGVFRSAYYSDCYTLLLHTDVTWTLWLAKDSFKGLNPKVMPA